VVIKYVVRDVILEKYVIGSMDYIGALKAAIDAVISGVLP